MPVSFTEAYQSRDREKKVAKVSGILPPVNLSTLMNESQMVFGRLSSHPELTTRPVGDFDFFRKRK